MDWSIDLTSRPPNFGASQWLARAQSAPVRFDIFLLVMKVTSRTLDRTSCGDSHSALATSACLAPASPLPLTTSSIAIENLTAGQTPERGLNVVPSGGRGKTRRAIRLVSRAQQQLTRAYSLFARVAILLSHIV